LQPGHVVAEVGLARELREPDEDVLAGADRQRREGVLGVLGLEARQRRGSRPGQYRSDVAGGGGPGMPAEPGGRGGGPAAAPGGWQMVGSTGGGGGGVGRAGGRRAGGGGKPEPAVTGRSSSTLRVSIIVALAWALCPSQPGPP